MSGSSGASARGKLLGALRRLLVLAGFFAALGVPDAASGAIREATVRSSYDGSGNSSTTSPVTPRTDASDRYDARAHVTRDSLRVSAIAGSFGYDAAASSTTPRVNTRTNAARGGRANTGAWSSTSSIRGCVATKAGTGAISKPPAGRGSVPSADRDPRRLYPRSEVQKGLDEQGGLCARCKNPIDDLADARGHHRKRHADGGRTDDDNLAVLCPECHTEIHRRR